MANSTDAAGKAIGASPELAREWERAWDGPARQAATRSAPAHAGGASSDANGVSVVLAPATPEQLDGSVRAPAPQVGGGVLEPDLAALVRDSPFLDLDSPMTAYEWSKAVAMVRPWGCQPSYREAHNMAVPAAYVAEDHFRVVTVWYCTWCRCQQGCLCTTGASGTIAQCRRRPCG